MDDIREGMHVFFAQREFVLNRAPAALDISGGRSTPRSVRSVPAATRAWRRVAQLIATISWRCAAARFSPARGALPESPASDNSRGCGYAA
jgi:hypothetical protein